MRGKRDIPVAPRIPTFISCLVAGIVYSMKEKENYGRVEKSKMVDSGYKIRNYGS
jgi:hypothetical protein